MSKQIKMFMESMDREEPIPQQEYLERLEKMTYSQNKSD